MQGTDLQHGWSLVVHLVECVQKGAITLTDEDVFDPTNKTYGYRVALAYVAQHSLEALGRPFPGQGEDNEGGEKA